MQDILKEYGPAIISVVAILGLVAILSVVLSTSETGVVRVAFEGLLNNFFSRANAQLAGAVG